MAVARLSQEQQQQLQWHDLPDAAHAARAAAAAAPPAAAAAVPVGNLIRPPSLHAGLHEGTLEQLAEMRAQFADMLADAGLLERPRGGMGAGGGRRRGGAAAGWLDAPGAPWAVGNRRPELLKAALCGALSPQV
eukprot:364914-Chlamydomonas_euryale.AAC.14